MARKKRTSWNKGKGMLTQYLGVKLTAEQLGRVDELQKKAPIGFSRSDVIRLLVAHGLAALEVRPAALYEPPPALAKIDSGAGEPSVAKAS